MVDAGEVDTVFRTPDLSHPNTTIETTLVEHLLLEEKISHTFSLINLSLVNPTTIRVFQKTDGSTYEKLAEAVYPNDFTDGVTGIELITDGKAQDMKVTLQSSVAEGSAKTIPASVRDLIRT